MKANEHLAAICQQAAVLMHQRGGVDWAPGPPPPPRTTVETQFGGCRYRLRFPPTAEAAEARAKRLLRAVSSGTNFHPLPRKPSLARAKYSQAVYDQFIEDGEHENAEAYRGLYE